MRIVFSDLAEGATVPDNTPTQTDGHPGRR